MSAATGRSGLPHVCTTPAFINADASRSGIGRLLRREGLAKLADLMPVQEGQDKPKKTFKDDESGYLATYLHVDIEYLPQMPDESARRYRFVAIDRATRWVFWRTYGDQTERSGVDVLRRLHHAVPFKISKLLTDNGTPFTDRFTSKDKQPTGHTSLISRARH